MGQGRPGHDDACHPAIAPEKAIQAEDDFRAIESTHQNRRRSFSTEHPERHPKKSETEKLSVPDDEPFFKYANITPFEGCFRGSSALRSQPAEETQAGVVRQRLRKDGYPTRLQATMEFIADDPQVEMVQYAMPDDDVELAVRERKPMGIGDTHLNIRPMANTPLSFPHSLLGDVNSPDGGPMIGQLGHPPARPATDFQHRFPGQWENCIPERSTGLRRKGEAVDQVRRIVVVSVVPMGFLIFNARLHTAKFYTRASEGQAQERPYAPAN